MLDEDARCHHKQRHAAKRADERLADEHGWDGSHSTARRRVKRMKELRRAASGGHDDLEWPPGSMQAGFGQADFDMPPGRERMHFPPCPSPQSNHALAQVFGDERAVCVARGPEDAFGHVGGVPPAIVFDNATEVGRRMRGIVRESAPFRAFRMRYGLEAVLCSPDSGHGRGNVGNKVARTRPNEFVPVPRVDDLAAYNREPLRRCDAASAAEARYGKGLAWAELFEADRAALLPLPAGPFGCADWRAVRADRYGRVAPGAGRHKCLAHAGLAGRDLVVGVRALTVEIWAAQGEHVRDHGRRFGGSLANDEDPLAVLGPPRTKPRAFSRGSIRPLLDGAVAARTGAMEGADRGRAPEEPRKVALAHGLGTAARAHAEVLAATGGPAASDVETAAARMARGAPEPTGTAKPVACDGLPGRRGPRMARDPQKVDARLARPKEMERRGGSVPLGNATHRRCAEEATDGRSGFPCEVLQGEHDARFASRVSRLRRQAGLPCPKGFSDFGWEGVASPAGFDRDEMPPCGFVERNENVVLFGGVGNGKSHTAIALGTIACGMGYRVPSRHTAQLVPDPSAAAAAGGPGRRMSRPARCDMMILDGWGYLPTDPEGAKLLFRVVSMCHGRVSLVITTNTDLSRRGKVLDDEDMAAAMLDRVVHHGRLVTYERESYRMRHAPMRVGVA